MSSTTPLVATDEDALTGPVMDEPDTLEPTGLAPPPSTAEGTETYDENENETTEDMTTNTEAVDHEIDADSAIDTRSFASDTTSLDSSITAYRIENGRRYHAYKDGSYWIPTDDLQKEQLDIGLILDGKLFLAPIGNNPQRVLDLGTGTGIWAIDFADQYPSASVIGTDLAPIQPGWVPPNLWFLIEDFNDDWTFKPDEFDLIHVRCVYGCSADWPRFYQKAFEHLKPGGWFEHYETSLMFRSDDGSVKPDSEMVKFNELVYELGTKVGKTMTLDEEMKDHIKNAGFINICERGFKTPHGGWAADIKWKEIGNWGRLELEVGLEGFSMAVLTRKFGWSYAEVQLHLTKIRSELRTRRIHAYHNIRVVFAQKPLQG